MPKQRTTRTILGLDPGYGRTGYAVITRKAHDLHVETYGCIETPPKTPYSERLCTLERSVCKLLDRYRPDIVAVEQLFVQKNVKTVIAVGQARGVLLLTVAKRGVVLCEFNPQQVKTAVTGYGKADKRQIQRMTQILFRLPTLPQPDDAADALALAYAAATTPLVLSAKPV